jgi:hypothetical protein
VLIVEVLGTAAFGLLGVLEAVSEPVRTTAVPVEETDEYGSTNCKVLVEDPTLAI